MPLCFPIRSASIEALRAAYDQAGKAVNAEDLFHPLNNSKSPKVGYVNALSVQLEEITPDAEKQCITLSEAVSILCTAFTKVAQDIDCPPDFHGLWEYKIKIEDTLLVEIICYLIQQGERTQADLISAVERRLTNLNKANLCHSQNAHILFYNPAIGTTSLVAPCVIPRCPHLVPDIYTTPHASAIGGFAVIEDNGKLHVEGLCDAHRNDTYVNEQMDHVAELFSLDFSWICVNEQETGSDEQEKDETSAKHRGRNATRPHYDFDDEPLEIVTLAQSRRQNSSFIGNVFDAVDGGHFPISPDSPRCEAERETIPSFQVTLED